MLSSLQIENVAVIQKADVHFQKGLNVLTVKPAQANPS